jgi:hypothetical protein
VRETRDGRPSDTETTTVTMALLQMDHVISDAENFVISDLCSTLQREKLTYLKT